MYTPFKLFLLTLIAFLAQVALVGCSYNQFDFKNQTYTKCSVGYDTQIKSAEYNPDGSGFKVKGWNGTARIDAVIEALEAVK